MFSSEFCEIFKNTFFTEYLRVTVFDIRMQVVVIYNLDQSLQFVTVNFALFFVFNLVHASMSPEFLHPFVFRFVIFRHTLQENF